jgi:hypothetical protein
LAPISLKWSQIQSVQNTAKTAGSKNELNGMKRFFEKRREKKKQEKEEKREKKKKGQCLEVEWPSSKPRHQGLAMTGSQQSQ